MLTRESRKSLAIFLGLVLGGFVVAPSGHAQKTSGLMPREGEEVATLAGGCFWCTEAVFERMKGVNDVVSGYTGDPEVTNPNYQMVLSKRTKHAEAIQIFYDPNVVSYRQLLDVFFQIHNPMTLNQQGVDKGPQYRSAIFYHDEAQKAEAEKVIVKLNKSPKFRRPIVTEVTPVGQFHLAEEYHQDYFRKNPYQAYCQSTVAPKIRKFDNLFKDQVRTEGIGSR